MRSQWRDSWAIVGCKGEAALKEMLSRDGAASVSIVVDPNERLKTEMKMVEASLKEKPQSLHVAGIDTVHPKESYLSQELRKSSLGGEQTQEIAAEMARQAKFMKSVLSMDFAKLTMTTDKDGHTFSTAVQKIDGIQYSFYIPHTEAAALQLWEVPKTAVTTPADTHKIEQAENAIKVGDKSYSVKLSVPLYFNRGDQTNQIVRIGLYLGGANVLGALLVKLFTKLGETFLTSLKHMFSLEMLMTLLRMFVFPVRYVFSFMVQFVARLLAGEALGVALRGAGAIAYARAANGLVRASVIRAGALTLAAVGISIFLALVPHSSHQVVYIYNLTDHDMTVKIPYVDYGKPLGISTDDPCVVPSVSEDKTSAVPLGTNYNAQAFGFTSDGDWTGLGYVAELTLSKDKASISAFCLFDIPLAGDNSVYGTFDSIGSGEDRYKKFYSAKSGTQKMTQYSTKTADGKIEMILTYDYLSGKHTDSQSGQGKYIYKSLLIIREA